MGGAEGEALDFGERRYPQTWLLVDVAEREPRLLGHEIVDLSPGAIELRQCARELRRFAEVPSRWLPLRPETPLPTLAEGHTRALSFGPSVSYCVELDQRRRFLGGRPFRHLALRATRGLTPGTSAEIGVHFYGRRPAVFAFTSPRSVHGYIGMDWAPLDAGDVRWLLDRELRNGRESD